MTVILPPFTVEQRDEHVFAVMSLRPGCDQLGVVYSGDKLTLCITDGREEAEAIAAAMNARAHEARAA